MTLDERLSRIYGVATAMVEDDECGMGWADIDRLVIILDLAQLSVASASSRASSTRRKTSAGASTRNGAARNVRTPASRARERT